MASTINASNGATSGLIQTGDSSGILALQVNNGTNALTLNTSGAVGVGNSPSYGSSGNLLISGGSAAAPSWSSTITNPTITNYVETPYSANSGSSLTLDLANGTLQIITLTASCTFTFPTATAGKSFMMMLIQNGTGGWSVTWPSVTNAVKWPGGTAPTITSTASKGDKYIFTADGTYWWGSNAGQNYL